MKERRRHPRRLVEGQVAMLPTTLNVQVLDITAAGALLEATRPVEPGTPGMFRLNLGGRTFSAEMHVQRVSPAPGGLGFRLGVVFVGVSAADEKLIDGFINQ